MSWWASPEPGDWVRTTRTLPLTLTDHLLGDGAGLPAGSRGVVLSRNGGRLSVEFDGGWGPITATIRVDDCRIQRRGAGPEAFRSRARRLALVRVSLAVALTLPVLQFLVAYLWQNGSFDGIIAAFAAASVYGALDFLAAAVQHPVQAAVYCVVVTVLTRFAFGGRS